jgi:superfamily II DNA/RNA helicase
VLCLLQLRELLRLAPRNRQTMLFSATFNDDVQQLAGEWCPVLLAAGRLVHRMVEEG